MFLSPVGDWYVPLKALRGIQWIIASKNAFVWTETPKHMENATGPNYFIFSSTISLQPLGSPEAEWGMTEVFWVQLLFSLRLLWLVVLASWAVSAHTKPNENLVIALAQWGNPLREDGQCALFRSPLLPAGICTKKLESFPPQAWLWGYMTQRFLGYFPSHWIWFVCSRGCCLLCRKVLY